MTTPISNDSGRRVTIDLTAAAVEEVERLRSLTGLTIADVFRHALSLMRIYINAKSKGQELQIVDPATPNRSTLIEFPIQIKSEKQNDGKRPVRTNNT